MSVLGDVLAKLAASKGRMTVPQSRSGRRPMTVSTMLRKDQEGTLFRPDATKEGSGVLPAPLPQVIARDPGEPPGRPARASSREGDAPTRDDVPLAQARPAYLALNSTGDTASRSTL